MPCATVGLLALAAAASPAAAALAHGRSASPRVCRAHPLASSAPAGLAASLPVPAALSAALLARGITSPTPIQSASFARITSGESVVLHAETGSGKSLAFLLPLLLRLAPDEKMLVVAPTRELAVQLGSDAAGVVAALGGSVQLAIVGTAPSVEALAAARVLVGTPAELDFALCNSPYAQALSASFVQKLGAIVLDEVDKLLPVTQTFGPQAARIKRASNRAKAHVSPTEALLLALLERTPNPNLQLVAASGATRPPTPPQPEARPLAPGRTRAGLRVGSRRAGSPRPAPPSPLPFHSPPPSPALSEPACARPLRPRLPATQPRPAPHAARPRARTPLTRPRLARTTPPTV